MNPRPSPHTLRCFSWAMLTALAWLTSIPPARPAVADFTERGKIDFDTTLQLLNPYGTWSKIDGRWAFTPCDHHAPYSVGRWLYSEYGWYWQGTAPHSWATEHYGYWKRGTDGIWSWFPGPVWLPQIVEMRSTSTHVGWRSAEVDSDGNFVEPVDDRLAKVDEWSWVSRAQFAQPITPASILPAATATRLLPSSNGATHTYYTYRAITRPGPHPADFLSFVGQSRGGFRNPLWADAIFPPRPRGESVAPAMPAPAGSMATIPDSTDSTATNALDKPDAPQPVDDSGVPYDPRQVPYWVTMSLPTFWTPPPDAVQPNEIYVYQPDLYQDADGIERRVTLWFNPRMKTSMGDFRSEVVHGAKAAPSNAPSSSHTGQHSAFGNPFEDPFRSRTPGAVAKASPTQAAPAPDGRAATPTNAASTDPTP